MTRPPPHLRYRELAVARRDTYEARVLAAMRAALARFLVRVEALAAAAIDPAAPVTAAAPPPTRGDPVTVAAPLSAAEVDEAWAAEMAAVAAVIVGALPAIVSAAHRQAALAAVAARLAALPIPAAAHTTATSVLNGGIIQGWTRYETFQALGAALDPATGTATAVPSTGDPDPTPQGRSWSEQVEAAARTEANGAYGDAASAVLSAAGSTLKTWVTVGDDRVRDAHAAAAGQTVPIGQPFSVGGEDLMYPGDPSGSAGNIRNCRCTLVAGD